jgi:3-phosphoshikimate 1-carboxyvinyltransferase
MHINEIIVHPTSMLDGNATPPGAKSDTVRAVLSATLAKGRSRIINGGKGDNSCAMVRACQNLGAIIAEDATGVWTVDGVGAELPDEVRLNAGNSGIVLRLLAAIGSTTRHCIVDTSCPESLGRRGNIELVESLRQLGAVCYGSGEDARPPLVVGRGDGLHGGTITISGHRSSQFLSGLLFLSPLIEENVEITVIDDLPSRLMVMKTIDTLAQAGIEVTAGEALRHFTIRADQQYRPATFYVASDASSITGLLAAITAVPDSRVKVTNFFGDDLGTQTLIGVLNEMGASIEQHGNELICQGAPVLHPIDLDGARCPDSILPLVALACSAEGKSVFYNIGNLRFKECDRISDFRAELVAAGSDVEETRDSLIVNGHGRVLGGVKVQAHNDHSVVMALTVLALRSDHGLTVQEPGVVAQTYPTFFQDLEQLHAKIERR